MTTDRGPTPRHKWSDAIDDDDALDPYEFTIARLFAKFSGSGTESVWVARSELEKRMSRTKALACVRSLVAKGWLIQTRGPRQHRSPEYRLNIPQSRVSGDDTLAETGQPATSSRVPSDDTLTGSRVSGDERRVSPHDQQGVTTRTPTPNRTSNGTTPSSPPLSDREQLANLLSREGLSRDEIDRIIAMAQADPTTTSNAIGRLLKVASYRAAIVRQLAAEDARAEARRDEALPKCPDCGKSLPRCDVINLKLAPEARCRRFDDQEKVAS